MITVQNERRSDAEVRIDDHVFINCIFTNCRLRYGGGEFAWKNSNAIDCTLSFDGAAGRTVALLKLFRLAAEDPHGQLLPHPVIGRVH